MSLTKSEITAGQTYTVRLDQTNSFKRRNDALRIMKGIGQRPEHAAAYDGGTYTWTVTLPSDSVNGLRDLRDLAYAYDAEVEVAGEPAPAPSRPAQARQGHSDWAEYGSGFSPEEESFWRGEQG